MYFSHYLFYFFRIKQYDKVVPNDQTSQLCDDTKFFV
jgi:hypothetical protein